MSYLIEHNGNYYVTEHKQALIDPIEEGPDADLLRVRASALQAQRVRKLEQIDARLVFAAIAVIGLAAIGAGI